MNKILKENNHLLGDINNYFDSTQTFEKKYIDLISFICDGDDVSTIEQLKIDILENEIIDIFEKNTSDYTKEDMEILSKSRKNYEFILNDIYKKRKVDIKYLILFCQSDIFLSGNATKIFNSSNLKKLNKITNYVSRLILELIKKYNNNPESLESEQIDLLFTFFKRKIDSPKWKNFYHNLVSQLINTDEKKLRFSQKLFLIEYINHWKCHNKGIEPAKIYVSNKDTKEKELESYGMSYGKKGIITINKELIDCKLENIDIKKHYFINSFEKSIHTTLHELEHYYQADSKIKEIFNYENFIYSMTAIFNKYLSTEQYKEYRRNYQYGEVEREANKNGWKEFVIFYTEHNGCEKIRNAAQIAWKEQYYSESFAIKWSKDGVKQERSIYNMAMIKQILEEHPEIINNYPIMELFLENNNIFISFEEIIKKLCSQRIKDKKETNTSREECMKRIYDDTIYWYLFMGPEIDFSKLNTQEKKYICILISEYYFKECKKIKDKMDYYKNDLLRNQISHGIFNEKIKNNLEEFDNKTLVNIDRVKKLYNFLMNLPENIESIAPEVDSYGYLDKEKINHSLESFSTRIEECGLTESKLAGELKELTNLYHKNKRGV